jgi:hypothetical protein
MLNPFIYESHFLSWFGFFKSVNLAVSCCKNGLGLNDTKLLDQTVKINTAFYLRQNNYS